MRQEEPKGAPFRHAKGFEAVFPMEGYRARVVHHNRKEPSKLFGSSGAKAGIGESLGDGGAIGL